jgi:hypothetical protein
VAYALFKTENALIYLRQLFVRRDRRREGVGRAAVTLLHHEVWPAGVRLTVDVLCANHGAIAVCRSVEYRDYSPHTRNHAEMKRSFPKVARAMLATVTPHAPEVKPR